VFCTCQVKETDSKVAAANSFTIFAGNRLLVVAASSESEKNKWMEDLELALEQSMSNKVETSKVLYPSLKSNSKNVFNEFLFQIF
jgi:FERM/RhoGEF/pleckstrin domain protein 2